MDGRKVDVLLIGLRNKYYLILQPLQFLRQEVGVSGIEHLPFWNLCSKGNSGNADRSFFRKSASLLHHSDRISVPLSTELIFRVFWIDR